MLITIIKKELKEIFREGRFKLLSSIVLLLLVISAWVSYNYQQQLRELHQQAQETERRAWETQKAKNPHSAAHFGHYVFKPVYPLSVIDPGVDRYTGVMQYLEAHKRNHEQFSAVQDQTELARFADLTPAFVLLYLVPVLIIVIGFNSLSREKETGALKILLTQGASSFTIAAGKWLAVLISVLLLLLPLMLLMGGLLSGKPNFHWSSYLLFLTAYTFYYAVVAGVTLFISSVAKRSGTAFIISLLFWITITILIPRIFSNVANSQSPLLTNEQMIAMINKMNQSRGGNIHDLAGEMYKKMVDSLLKKYNADSVSQLPVNMAGIRLDRGEQMDTRNYEIVYDSVFRQMDRQQQWLEKASVLSPFLSVHAASMHLAQTDNENHRHFTEAGELYRRDFVNRMNRHIAYDSRLQESFTRFDAPESLWRSVPKFQYTPISIKQVIHNSQFSLSVLAGWLLLVLSALFIAAKKLKP